jgi:hypothetical protein
MSMKKQPVRGQAADKRQEDCGLRMELRLNAKQSASGVPSKKNYLI